MPEEQGVTKEVKELTALLGKHFVKSEKVVLPIFAGNSGKSKQTPYFEWRYMVTKIGKLKKDQEFELLVLNSLTAEARTRFIRLESENTTFDNILNKFDVIYKDSTDLMQRVQKLHEITQNKSETINDFIDRLETCTFWVTEMEEASAFYKNDAFLKMKVSQSLINKNLTDKLLYMVSDTTKTFTDYRNALIDLEKKSSDDVSVKIIQPTKSIYEDRISKLEEKIDKLLDQGVSTPKKTEHRKQTMKCWRCDKIGHMKRDCRVKLTTNQQGN